MAPRSSAPKLPDGLSEAATGVRDVLDKDKSNGWGIRVQEWAAGRKKLSLLLAEPDLPEEAFQDFHEWAENKLEGLIIAHSVSQFLAFFLSFLHLLADKYLQPASETKRSRGPNVTDEVIGRVEKLIALVTNIVDSDTAQISTKEWLILMKDLLDHCLNDEFGDDILQDNICELLHRVVSNATNTTGKAIMVDEKIMGYEKIGSWLYRSKSSGTSIWLLRIMQCLLPPTSERSGRETALRTVITAEKWSTSVAKICYREMWRVNGDHQPDHLMTIINLLALDKSLLRPRAFQLNDITINSETQLSSDKAKRYRDRGLIIMYVDQCGLLIKSFDNSGSQEDITFRMSRIIQLGRQSRIEFIFQCDAPDSQGGRPQIRLDLYADQADVFKSIMMHYYQTLGQPKLTDPENPLQCESGESAESALQPTDVEAEILRWSSDQETVRQARSALKDSNTQLERFNPFKPFFPLPGASTTKTSVKTIVSPTRQSLPASAPNKVNDSQRATQLGSNPVTTRSQAAVDIKVAAKSAASSTTPIERAESLDKGDSGEKVGHENAQEESQTRAPKKGDQDAKDRQEHVEDEDMQLPPASQQLVTSEDNATTRSSRRFGKSATLRSTQPVTILDDDSDLSADEAPGNFADIFAAQNRDLAFGETLPQAKDGASSKSKSGPLALTTKASATETLHTQIKKGKAATPSSVRSSNAKSRTTKAVATENQDQAIEKAKENVTPEQLEKANNTAVPKTRARAALTKSQVAPPSPKKPRATRRSQLAQMVLADPDLDAGEAHPPLPWQVGSDAARKAGPESSVVKKKAAATLLYGTDRSSKKAIADDEAVPAANPAEHITPDIESSEDPFLDSHANHSSFRREQHENDLGVGDTIARQSLSKNLHPAVDTSAQVGSSLSDSTIMPSKTATHKIATENTSQVGDMPNASIQRVIVANTTKPRTRSDSPSTQSQAHLTSQDEHQKHSLDVPEPIEEEVNQPSEPTPRPRVTRRSVIEMFKRDNDEEESRSTTKKARIAELPSSEAEDVVIEQAKGSKIDNKGGISRKQDLPEDKPQPSEANKRKRSSEGVEDQEAKKKVRRRSDTPDVKAFGEADKVEKKATAEINDTLGQIADLISDRMAEQMREPLIQAKLSRRQFGRLGQALLDNYHKESKNQLKILRKKSKVAITRYEQIKGKEVKGILTDYEKSKSEMDKLVEMDEKRWELSEKLF
ncbi:uncharacterized protein I303_102026 [Kwoniella dejecticola CBS 10117]|uniref:Uncharacterized protein n=1 Tax=Kwoniella dejecticola CBS 10117 TaxID=1296121 RepID=A0AAJ8KKY6_9TREE